MTRGVVIGIFSRKVVFTIGLSLFCLCVFCQKNTDSVFFLANKKGLIGKIGKSVSIDGREPAMPIDEAQKNADEFEPFRGKIISGIKIIKPGFTKSVRDTLLKKNFFNDLGDKLHTKTKRQVILNNLFFSPGDTLYPNLVADNEKYLRDLSFLQDAQITVESNEVFPDSVTIVVYAKDVFPFGGSVSEGSTDKLRFELNNDNIMGSGNRIQIQQLFDIKRNPTYGLGVEYLQRNFAGTFINLTLGYQTQNPAFNTGLREEQAFYLRGALPLVSPYHVFTGGFDIGQYSTNNAYNNDSIYQLKNAYSYRLIDGWLGYNIGARKQLALNFASRKKKIISFRLIKRIFTEVPDITKQVYDSRYSDLTAALSSFTIFKQDFYHTNFIYGFGRNEDIPIGYNFSVTGGWTDRNDFKRPYMGVDYQKNYLTKKKGYLTVGLKAGGYYYDGGIEDFSVLSSIDFFSKLRRMGTSTWYSRHFITASIAHQFNTKLNDPLFLSSIYGIPNVNNTGNFASSRYSLSEECVFYNTWKLVGFRFAPFAFTNLTVLNSGSSIWQNGEGYAAIGAGVRTRNENLVFGTIELKTYYYPRIVGAMNNWNVTLSTDLRFRFVTQLIKQPDFIQVN